MEKFVWAFMIFFQIILMSIIYFVMGHTNFDLSEEALANPLVLPLSIAAIFNIFLAFNISRVLDKAAQSGAQQIGTAAVTNAKIRTSFIIKLAFLEFVGICGFLLSILYENFAFVAIGASISIIAMVISCPKDPRR